MKYTTTIEAVQWNGKNLKELEDFVGDIFFSHEKPFINTPEGLIQVKPKDYVIKNINGEFYTCEFDIFEKIYKEVDEKVQG